MTYGQIIEVYPFRQKTWLTVWEFASRRKFSIALNEHADFIEGDLVSVDRGADLVRFELVTSASLPAEFKPLVEVPDTAARIGALVADANIERPQVAI